MISFFASAMVTSSFLLLMSSRSPSFDPNFGQFLFNLLKKSIVSSQLSVCRSSSSVQKSEKLEYPSSVSRFITSLHSLSSSFDPLSLPIIYQQVFACQYFFCLLISYVLSFFFTKCMKFFIVGGYCFVRQHGGCSRMFISNFKLALIYTVPCTKGQGSIQFN